MNHICLSINLIRSFDVVFLTLSSETSFRFPWPCLWWSFQWEENCCENFAVWFLLGHLVSWCLFYSYSCHRC